MEKVYTIGKRIEKLDKLEVQLDKEKKCLETEIEKIEKKLETTIDANGKEFVKDCIEAHIKSDPEAGAWIKWRREEKYDSEEEVEELVKKGCTGIEEKDWIKAVAAIKDKSERLPLAYYLNKEECINATCREWKRKGGDMEYLPENINRYNRCCTEAVGKICELGLGEYIKEWRNIKWKEDSTKVRGIPRVEVYKVANKKLAEAWDKYENEKTAIEGQIHVTYRKRETLLDRAKKMTAKTLEKAYGSYLASLLEIKEKRREY